MSKTKQRRPLTISKMYEIPIATMHEVLTQLEKIEKQHPQATVRMDRRHASDLLQALKDTQSTDIWLRRIHAEGAKIVEESDK